MKFKPYYLLALLSLPLIGCTASNEGSPSSDISESTPSSEPSSSEENVASSEEDTRVQLPSIREVMTNLSKKRNYSYFLDDQILHYETKYYYTEHAYYYTYSKDNQAYGLAEDKNGDVFRYSLGENEVIPGEAYKNKDGQVYNDLWATSILSFADFRLDTLPNEENLDNTYEISDDTNKTLFAAMAGYADVYVMPYVTVTVKVTSENSFVSTVHFAPENAAYTGDCIGTVTSIDETKIPLIDEYIENGGGAKVVDQVAVIEEILKKLKESHNYKISVSKNGTPTYVDYFTEKYFYSENLSIPSSSKGHISVAGGIYNFTIKDDALIAGNEITYTSSENKTDVWSNSTSTFKNLANISLDSLTISLGEDGKYFMENAVSQMNTLLGFLHTGSFFDSVDTANDKVVFDSYDESSLTLTYFRANDVSYTLTFDSIGNTKIEAAEAYIEEKKNFDSNDLSKITNVLSSLKESKTYEVSFNPSFGAFSGISANTYSISYSPTEVIADCVNKPNESYSYKVIDGVVTKTTKDEEGNDVNRATEFETLWEADFPSFLQFDESVVVGKANLDGSYTITGGAFTTFLAAFGNVTSSSIATNFTSTSATLDEENKTISLKATSGFYGSFSVTVKY